MAGAAPIPDNPASNLDYLRKYINNPADALGESPAGAAHYGTPGQPAPKPKKDATPTLPTPEGAPTPPSEQDFKTGLRQAPEWVNSLPTPGSLLFPLLVIILFWVLIIKTNGKSRWEWLWEVLTGNAAVGTGAGTTNTPAGGVADISQIDANLKAAFSNDGPPSVTDLEESTFQPTFTFTPSSAIAVTGGP